MAFILQRKELEISEANNMLNGLNGSVDIQIQSFLSPQLTMPHR